jgi:hypothetical protein
MKFVDVAAASIAAYRASQQQVIASDGMNYSDPKKPVHQWSNKSLVLSYLKNKFPESKIKFGISPGPFELEVNDETYAEAERIINLISQSYVMALLSSQPMAKFFIDLAKLVEDRDKFTDANLIMRVGMLVYLPKIAAGLDERTLKQEKQQDFMVSTYLGKINTKLELEVTVFNTVFSQNWQRYYVKAYTSDNNVVFFGSQHNWEKNKQYRIRGRIKQLGVNARPGEPSYAMTSLSHVKILD